ncbi:DNA uptake porin HofQ [Atlantibacter subterraneus]|uniref:DNA uptake porin HofQ n=1 Tax=Atlantibacter subterraneus TaxID=255519 RepID=UPI003F589C1C
MARMCRLAGLMLLPLGAIAAKPASNISLVVDDVPIRQVLQALAETEKQNVIVAPEVAGDVTLHLVNVPWQVAFQTVAEIGQLHWRKEGNILRVYPAEWQQRQQQEEEQARLKRLSNQPLSTRTVSLRYADATELAAAMTALGDKLLGPKGSVMADKRTNRLLIDDNRAALKKIESWIASMDIPVGQVELSAHIVTINQTSLRELGVKWSTAEGEGKERLYRPSAISADLSVPEASTRLSFNVGRINGNMLDLELSALEQKHKLEIIASPRLLASHQQPASIKQGSEIPYQVSSGESGATSIEFKEAVLGMEVTPTIQPFGRIRMKLRISQNMPGQVLKQSDGEVMAIDKQEIETQVEIKDGETIALGGIFQQKRKGGKDSVPFLGDIPLLGGLFSYDGKDDERRELVVFITPRLIAPKT